MNYVFLVGNLGKDAELSYSKSGSPVANFSLATERKWKDQGGETQSETMWHTINVWGKPAEALSKYLLKGTQVSVVGQIKYSIHEAPDGTKKYYTAIESRDIKLLGGKRTPAHGDDSAAARHGADSAAVRDDDDVPF